MRGYILNDDTLVNIEKFDIIKISADQNFINLKLSKLYNENVNYNIKFNLEDYNNGEKKFDESLVEGLRKRFFEFIEDNNEFKNIFNPSSVLEELKNILIDEEIEIKITEGTFKGAGFSIEDFN